jgi:hypothetical protein
MGSLGVHAAWKVHALDLIYAHLKLLPPIVSAMPTYVQNVPPGVSLREPLAAGCASATYQVWFGDTYVTAASCCNGFLSRLSNLTPCTSLTSPGKLTSNPSRT